VSGNVKELRDAINEFINVGEQYKKCAQQQHITAINGQIAAAKKVSSASGSMSSGDIASSISEWREKTNNIKAAYKSAKERQEYEEAMNNMRGN